MNDFGISCITNILVSKYGMVRRPNYELLLPLTCVLNIKKVTKRHILRKLNKLLNSCNFKFLY